MLDFVVKVFSTHGKDPQGGKMSGGGRGEGANCSYPLRKQHSDPAAFRAIKVVSSTPWARSHTQHHEKMRAAIWNTLLPRVCRRHYQMSQRAFRTVQEVLRMFREENKEEREGTKWFGEEQELENRR